jgi:hypothetical protein
MNYIPSFWRIKTLYWEFDPGSGWTLAACLRHASRGIGLFFLRNFEVRTGKRVSNTLVTYLQDGDSPAKAGLIPDSHRRTYVFLCKSFWAWRGAYVWLVSWWGNSLPRPWSVAGVRAWPASLGLRHCPDSYGRLQSRIFDNGRKPDRATPRAGRSPSGCKLLFSGKNLWRYLRNKRLLTLCQQQR